VTGRYRFARRPKWIFGHVLAVVAVVGFVNLGFWQLRRHDERAEQNAVVEERGTASPAPLRDLIARYGPEPEALEYRRATITGTYVVEEEVLWQARTLRGVSGHDVLTPLLTEDGVVLIDRGWVPIDATGPPVPDASPPAGETTLVGLIRAGSTRSGLGPRDPETGVLQRVSRVDIDRLRGQITGDVHPFYVLLESQQPPQLVALPLLQDPPEVTGGPHLSYAVQWFVFAAIAAVGYPVLLRKTAQDED
jgi:cytochrome oxidase assembly protein ShyY1